MLMPRRTKFRKQFRGKRRGMAQSGMAHDSAAMPSLASMIQRTDSLLQRTARMIGDTNTATPRAMAMEHLAGDLSHTMAGHLQAMAIGLRGLLQQMAAMHRPGMQMDVDAESAMMDLHRRSNVILGEMEKAVQALDGLPKRDARGHP